MIGEALGIYEITSHSVHRGMGGQLTSKSITEDRPVVLRSLLDLFTADLRRG